MGRIPVHRAYRAADSGLHPATPHYTWCSAALVHEDRYLCYGTHDVPVSCPCELRKSRERPGASGGIPSARRRGRIATGPNEVWTWDITKLKGPRKWTYYYLYVILDIFSRQVVGWMVADFKGESASLAKFPS